MVHPVNRAPSPWEFNPYVLRHAIAQSADWKRRHGFPANVAAVITEPLIPEAPEPGNQKADFAVAPSSSSQTQAAQQHLIVDKAQVVTCAIVIRQGATDAAELSGYPVSGHGNLVRGIGQPLFSLNDPDEIGQVFPGLLEPPTSPKVTDGWLTRSARLMLPEAEQAEVRFENGSLLIALSVDQLDRWMNFVALAMQDQLYWQVPQAPLLKLCKVAVVRANSATNMRLHVLRSVLSLEQNARRAAIVQSEGTLRE